MGLFSPSESPGITIREIDLTGVAPNVSTSLAGFVGDFQWGPVEEIKIIKDEADLAATFGSPKSTNADDFLSAEYFLKYSQNLRVVRTVTASALTATAADSDATVTIKNEDDYDSKKSNFGDGGGEDDVGMWVAKYPGELGNSLSVSICAISDGDSDGTTSFDAWDYKNQFDTAPGTSQWAANRSASNDEVHVVVIDRLGKFSGTVGGVLEVFPYVSVAQGARTTDGVNNYIVDVINNNSNYVWFGYFDAVRSVTGTNWGAEPDQVAGTDYATGVSWTNGGSTNALGSGADSGDLTSAEYQTGYNLFSDKDTVNIDMLIVPGMSTSNDQVTVTNHVIGIAASRKDCVAVSSPGREAVIGTTTPVDDTVAEVNDYTASNYSIVDNNYLKVYDKYNRQYVFIPAASSTAGVMAASDAAYGPWYSPAGEKRGRYLGVVSLAYNPNKGDRDELYKVGVNPVVNFPGRGVVLYGDKTRESRPSAFDRINVRRLFLALEKSIGLAARNVMFEFNDEFTRAEFVGIIEPALREIQGRRGIQEYYVQCDETNNTPAVIDRNELVASIFIKPARSINFITLNFVAVRSGVEFEEVVGTV